MNKKHLTKKEIKRWWEYKRNLRWDDIYGKKDYTSLALNNRMKKILFYLDDLKLKKASILEIGFGGGQLAYEILRRGHIYSGIELSKNFVKLAKKRCRKFSHKCSQFKVSSIENPLKFKSEYFDVVIEIKK